MTCPNCGASVKLGAKFCGSCGSQLTSSSGGNTSYPTVVGSTQNPLGLPPCQFKVMEAKGEGPDDDGDIRIELKYSVSNTTKQTWDYLAVTTQLVNFDGQVIEQSTDSFEQTLEPNDDTELDVYFGAANLKLLGAHPEKSIIVSTITACKAEFVSLGSIDIPAEAFQVTSIQPIKLGESAQLLSGSVFKTEPDSDKDCQVQVKALIQNLTNLPLHEVKIIADVTDKSGRELCDAGGYEQLKPGELLLIQGNGYTKDKTLKSAKVELAIRCYSSVAVSIIQTNGLNINYLKNTQNEKQSSNSTWPHKINNDDTEMMEIELIDIKGKVYIYWLRKDALPYSDDVDSALEIALNFHIKNVGTEIPDDDYTDEDNPKIYKTAYDAFTRNDDEYTLIKPEKKTSKITSDDYKIITLEWEMDRGMIDPESIEDSEILNILDNCKKLIKQKKHKEAIKLLPKLDFEFSPENLDSDASEFFSEIETISFSVDLNSDKNKIQIGMDDENLVISAAIVFEVKVHQEIDFEEFGEWLSDNGGYSAGYISGGWGYSGDEGGNLICHE